MPSRRNSASRERKDLSGARAGQPVRGRRRTGPRVSAGHRELRASRILGRTLNEHIGRPFSELDTALAAGFETGFAEQALAATPKDSWQQQIEVKRAGASPMAESLMLLARGSRLPLEDGLGYVIVFDDITQVISAQRAVAWAKWRVGWRTRSRTR